MIIKAIKKLIARKPAQPITAEAVKEVVASCTCTHHRHTSKGPKHFKSMRSPKHA